MLTSTTPVCQAENQVKAFFPKREAAISHIIAQKLLSSYWCYIPEYWTQLDYDVDIDLSVIQGQKMP